MRLFGSALVPDFQQHYGLRLTRVLEEWEPREVLLLIAGLPEESRFNARLIGETSMRNWSNTEWLLFDMRNAVEALRFMQAAQGKKKPEFSRWERYPGAEAVKRRRIRSRLDGWWKMLGNR